eukprot:g83396.t1
MAQRRHHENIEESKIRAGLPSPVAILWGLDDAGLAQAAAGEARAPPRARHCVPGFALTNAQRRRELLATLYCPLPLLEETRQDLLTQARAREPGGRHDLLCKKRKGIYHWRQDSVNALVRLLCRLDVPADCYAQHKSQAAQWQFLRRAYLGANQADLPRVQTMLSEGFEEAAATCHHKLVSRQSARVADALRLLYARRGDLVWARVQSQQCSPLRVPLFLDALSLERQLVRLHLRLYRHKYAEQVLPWWRRGESGWDVAARSTDARDDRALEALAKKHPHLQLGAKPYAYVSCVLERRGYALRGVCSEPHLGPGYYQILWLDLNDGYTRWFSQELAPWAASHLGWPTCVSDLIGLYCGPVGMWF